MIGNVVAAIVTNRIVALPVSGASLWLDASDATTFSFSSGTVVSEWRDKTINAYHFAQTTGSLQPERQNNIQNSLPSVYFNADLLTNSSWNWSTSAFTFFVVVKNRTTPSYDGIFSRNASNALQLGFNNTDKYAISKIGTATSASNLSLTTTNSDVVVFKSSGVATNVSVTIYKNGTAASSDVSLTSLVSGDKNVLGATRDTAGDPIVGYISEVIIYPSQLSDSDRNSVESYLKTKWATP